MSGRNLKTGEAFVTVEIYDQTYDLRGEDSAYLEELAAVVDACMRTVAAHGTTVDSLRVAVLAALNLADELTTAAAQIDAIRGQEERQRSRAHSLTGILDKALSDETADAQRRAG